MQETTPEETTEKAIKRPKSGKTDGAAEVRIPPIESVAIEVTVVGITPLITDAMGPAAMKAIKDHAARTTAGPKVKERREARDPQAEYEATKYRLPDGKDAFPAGAFRKAMIAAARYSGGMSMVYAVGAVQIEGDLVELQAKPPTMREDVCRVGRPGARVPMLRYRAMYPKGWRLNLVLRFNKATIKVEEVLNLLNLAGFHIGVGNWRPEKGGSFGMFTVAT